MLSCARPYTVPIKICKMEELATDLSTMAQQLLLTNVNSDKSGMVVVLSDNARVEVRAGTPTRHPYAVLFKTCNGR